MKTRDSKQNIQTKGLILRGLNIKSLGLCRPPVKRQGTGKRKTFDASRVWEIFNFLQKKDIPHFFLQK